MNVKGKDFGSAIKVSIFACKGKSSEQLCNDINTTVISAINMNISNLSPKCWQYPLENGKGGTGITLIQPLVESFVAWDTWVDYEGAYFFVVSCKEYDPKIIEDILSNHFEIIKRDVIITGLSKSIFHRIKDFVSKLFSF